MSDKEESRSASPEVEENGSANGINDDDGAESPRHRSRDRKGSRSVSRSRSRSRSRDRSHKRSHRRRRSYSRSRSRSPRRSSRRHRRSRSRSRSDSYDRDRYRRRSRSRSPMSSRKRHIAPRDDPPASRCVGVFGMSLYTDEKTITNFFSQFGKIEQIQLVYDKKTGRSRGFGFIYYENTDDAVNAKERAAGAEIDGHRIRVDFSITKRPHTPTPGIYMGKPTRRRGDDYYRGRSPSPYYSRGRRSRSYSYSPRRE